jgi:hypothetical protein
MPVQHPETFLPPNCEMCGVGTVRIGKLPRIGLRPLVYVFKCGGCNQITSVEPEAAERSGPAPLGVGAPAAASVGIDRI